MPHHNAGLARKCHKTLFFHPLTHNYLRCVFLVPKDDFSDFFPKVSAKPGYRAPAALPVPFQFLQANTCPLYLTLTGFDQNQELVHFGKLTPPQNGRIPEMQMPVFSRIFMLQDVQDQGEKIWLWDLHWPSLPTWILTKTKKLAISAK